MNEFLAPTRTMASNLSNNRMLIKAFSIIESTPEIQLAVTKIRDLLNVDHIVYHTSKYGMSPSADPYIRLTYPSSWIKHYLQMGYADVDPVVREGFSRTLPFDWATLTKTAAQEAFFSDAAEHGVGPFGFSIPVQNKHGHRALFSISFSRSEKEWTRFLAATRPALIQIAHRIHRRVIGELFGMEHPHLSAREIECLHWIAAGKDANEIAIILNISPYTAREYLKSARYKLDCVTSAQAISKAAKLGLLVF